jgi:putative transposase
MEITYRTGRHCVFVLHCHLIFITKYRGKVFNSTHLETLEKIIRNVCEQFECEAVEFNGGSDHVHILLNFPPKVSISKLVNSLKGVSSRKMKS